MPLAADAREATHSIPSPVRNCKLRRSAHPDVAIPAGRRVPKLDQYSRPPIRKSKTMVCPSVQDYGVPPRRTGGQSCFRQPDRLAPAGRGKGEQQARPDNRSHSVGCSIPLGDLLGILAARAMKPTAALTHGRSSGCYAPRGTAYSAGYVAWNSGRTSHRADRVRSVRTRLGASRSGSTICT